MLDDAERYADAEPLLLDSYHDLTSSHSEKDPRIIGGARPPREALRTDWQ